MRTVFGLVLVSAFVASATALAGASAERFPVPQGGAIEVPAASPVHGGKPAEGGGATFPGKFVLTGTFTIDYRDGPAAPEFSFTPDAAIAAQLPRADGEHKVASVVFEDAPAADAVIAAIVPATTLADIKAHPAKQAMVHIALDVDRYTAAIQECTGEGWYTVRFVSVHTPGTVKIGKTPPREEGEDC